MLCISFIPQCAIPVFEGLLPEPYNSVILDLLFTLAEWHALAKLRMHTESTVELLRGATRTLGQTLRRFQKKVCDAFPNTKELDKEEAARGRRIRKRNNEPVTAQNVKIGKAQKLFNWATYKFHSMGDYWPTIPWVGTSDSYTSQTVCPLLLSLHSVLK